MQNNLHSHFYEGKTSLVFNHTHLYSGETSQEPDYRGHVHYLSGYTSVDNGHAHYYSVMTGPPIEVANGHTHYYMGYTTTDNHHFHNFWGYTYLSNSYQEPKKHFTAEEAKGIGNQLGIDFSKFDVEQYRTGLDVELEHGRINLHTNITNDDPIITGKITLAHLNEFPDYYIRLTKMEDEAEEYFKKK